MSIDPTDAEAILEAQPDLTEEPDAEAASGLPIPSSHFPEPDNAAVTHETVHQFELDRLLANDKIRSDDPNFDQRAQHRRAAVYLHEKRRPAIGQSQTTASSSCLWPMLNTSLRHSRHKAMWS